METTRSWRYICLLNIIQVCRKLNHSGTLGKCEWKLLSNKQHFLNGYFGSRNLELFSLRIRIEAHKRWKSFVEGKWIGNFNSLRRLEKSFFHWKSDSSLFSSCRESLGSDPGASQEIKRSQKSRWKNSKKSMISTYNLLTLNQFSSLKKLIE